VVQLLLYTQVLELYGHPLMKFQDLGHGDLNSCTFFQSH
jgi:hypothetical protein